MPWPPKEWQPILRDIVEADAWWSGDEQRLAEFYGGAATQDATRRRRGVINRVKFWARRLDDLNTDRQRLHIPAAADIAATSADLLFGEAPTLTIAEAHEVNADAAAKAAEDRLVELLEVDGVASALLEAAEVCAALGGVYLRPVWAPELAGHPLLTVVHPDQAVPEFRYGRLAAVTFWRVVRHDANVVWRHLERHEPGVILHGLYAGSPELLGSPISLDASPETRGLDETVRLPGGWATLGCRYVPNARPNRRHRRLPIGRADTQGVEALMDALDETWSAWMRDIRLAKHRIIVPGEFLDRNGRGGGASFDLDREVFSPLDMDPMSREKTGITLTSFAIRAEEHAATAAELWARIVQTAGYSPQSFGMHGTGAVDRTATEVRADETRSLRTTSRKQAYWRQAVEDMAELMLVIDRDVFGSKVEPMRPRLDFPDGLPDNPREQAETVELLNRAQAVSTETKVRLAQPQLDEAEVQAEVARILAESGMTVTDPTGGVGGFDDSDEDGKSTGGDE